MNRAPLKIEELLDRMGSMKTPCDPNHRYELRRSLLCSKQFEILEDRQRSHAFVSFTIPLVAGGMLVIIFTFMSVSFHASLLSTPSTPSIAVLTTEAGTFSETQMNKELTNASNPFVDARAPVSLYEEVPFAQVRTASYILAR